MFESIYDHKKDIVKSLFCLPSHTWAKFLDLGAPVAAGLVLAGGGAGFLLPNENIIQLKSHATWI